MKVNCLPTALVPPAMWWNLARRDLRLHEGIVSGCEVNWLIDELCGERPPAIDFAHVDLA